MACTLFDMVSMYLSILGISRESHALWTALISFGMVVGGCGRACIIFFGFVPYWFYWVNIWWRGWVWKHWNLVVFEPLFCWFAGITWCTIMLKHDIRPPLLHLFKESVKVGFQDLRNIPWPHHTSTLSSWVFQHNERTFPALHDASPDHYSDWWLLECWYNTVFVIFFISMTCDNNVATMVIKMNIGFVWPY